MPKVLLSRAALKRIIRRRKESGAYRWDEVWDGVYVVSPDPDIQHQGLAFGLAVALMNALSVVNDARVFPSINLSDREADWRKNYRRPDASVFLPGNTAENRGSHYFGGPDFVVEILSRGDRARLKLPFDAGLGVREVLLVNRRPWRLELLRLDDDHYEPIGTSAPETSNPLPSNVLSLTFCLRPGEPRPRIELIRAADGARWTA